MAVSGPGPDDVVMMMMTFGDSLARGGGRVSRLSSKAWFIVTTRWLQGVTMGVGARRGEKGRELQWEL